MASCKSLTRRTHFHCFSKEDEGILLSVVLDGETETSYLLVLNAQTMKEVARTVLAQPIGFGFHGNFASTTVRIQD
jgi:torulene dioxygenase